MDLWKYKTNKNPIEIHMPKSTVVFNQEQETLVKLIGFLEENYQRDLSTEYIESKFEMSLRKISPFKEKHALSLKGFINELRLKESDRLLETATLKIRQIAFQVSFKTVNHFHKNFKKKNRISSGEFRDRNPS